MLKLMDSRFRGNDEKGAFKTFYETIIYSIFYKRFEICFSLTYPKEVMSDFVAFCAERKEKRPNKTF